MLHIRQTVGYAKTKLAHSSGEIESRCRLLNVME
jgi:hypothetical protein